MFVPFLLDNRIVLDGQSVPHDLVAALFYLHCAFRFRGRARVLVRLFCGTMAAQPRSRMTSSITAIGIAIAVASERSPRCQ